MVSARLVLRGTLLLALSILVAGAETQESSVSEEIPIERCDRLPVVTVQVDGVDMRFLVDTAATSILNLKSFSEGKSKEIQISSWRGATSTRAREVTLPELALGSYRLRHLKLPAIDLSPIAKACGGPIDGILGVDLLEKMGAIIDLKRRVALLPSGATSVSEQARLEEYRAHCRACVDALNRGDVQFLEGCFDAQIIVLTPWGEVQGLQAAVDYFRQRYFDLDPPAHFDLHDRDIRLLSDVAWVAFDYTIQLPDGVIEGRVTGMCRNTGGQWRIVSLHSSAVQAEKSPEH